MKTIEYIDKIRVTQRGVECKDALGKWVKAHYRQGDLDGACGVYSLTMVLLILGYLSEDEVNIDNDRLDLRKNRDRFLSRFYEEQGLIRAGYSSIVLRKDIARLCPEIDVKRRNPKDCDKAVEKIYEYLRKNLPVIISTEFKDGKDDEGNDKIGGHYLVAIGAEVENEIITKILCLDPGSPSTKIAPWNCVITTDSIRSDFPYWCISEDSSYKVKIDDLIIMQY